MNTGQRIIRDSWQTNDKKLREHAKREAEQHRKDRATLLENIKKLKKLPPE